MLLRSSCLEDVCCCCAGAKPSKTPVPAAASTSPEPWDSSVEALANMVKQLATQDPAAADSCNKLYEQLKQMANVPQHRHLLHAHAMRCLVQQAADKIDADAETVKQVSLGFQCTLRRGVNKVDVQRLTNHIRRQTLDDHRVAVMCLRASRLCSRLHAGWYSGFSVQVCIDKEQQRLEAAGQAPAKAPAKVVTSYCNLSCSFGC